MVKSTSENAPKNNSAKKIAKTKRKPYQRKRQPGKPGKAAPTTAAGLPSGKAGKPQAVVLIGFMGAGKSSVGRALSQMMGWSFEDLDDRIASQEGRTVADIFRDSGESEFRRAEHAALQALFSELRAGTNKVVALGGGAFVQDNNARLLAAKGAQTIFLDATVDELWRRCRAQVGEGGIERPLLGSAETFSDLYRQRRPHYLRASMRQETDGKSVDQIAAEVLRAIGLVPKRTKRTDPK